jgi:hypothetical protein
VGTAEGGDEKPPASTRKGTLITERIQPTMKAHQTELFSHAKLWPLRSNVAKSRSIRRGVSDGTPTD